MVAVDTCCRATGPPVRWFGATRQPGGGLSLTGGRRTWTVSRAIGPLAEPSRARRATYAIVIQADRIGHLVLPTPNTAEREATVICGGSNESVITLIRWACCRGKPVLAQEPTPGRYRPLWGQTRSAKIGANRRARPRVSGVL